MWELGSQELNDLETQASGESGVEKCCRNSLPWLRLSVAMFALRIISSVSILRGIIIIVLLAVLASAVIALHPQTKEVETVRAGDNTNNNRTPETQLHARFAGTVGEILVAILGPRPCRVFKLNTNWGQ